MGAADIDIVGTRRPKQSNFPAPTIVTTLPQHHDSRLKSNNQEVKMILIPRKTYWMLVQFPQYVRCRAMVVESLADRGRMLLLWAT